MSSQSYSDGFLWAFQTDWAKTEQLNILEPIQKNVI